MKEKCTQSRTLYFNFWEPEPPGRSWPPFGGVWGSNPPGPSPVPVFKGPIKVLRTDSDHCPRACQWEPDTRLASMSLS